ncbi:doublesex and mab-3 related transcription factor-like protein [Leptotrombidium deliense]|uniref:Doublesex and mab-3 related transcription factor-like protein n=1 Tax=Leptotrombidium deliense TaxID=299467 RepID=A0A443ST45_9ACAR|nr:doublesex and mab-3 related transcription factor-like protein [Leptotrombidium deliense]
MEDKAPDADEITFKTNSNSPSSSTSAGKQCETAFQEKAKKGRTPYCATCRVHNVQSILRGHKRDCRFKNCVCDQCQNVQERRRVMSKDISSKRKHQQEYDKAKAEGIDLEPKPLIEEAPINEQVTKNTDINNTLKKLEHCAIQLLDSLWIQQILNMETLTKVLIVEFRNLTIEQLNNKIHTGKYKNIALIKMSNTLI